MDPTERAASLSAQIADENRLGALRKRAKDLGVDHELGLALWSTGVASARRLAILLLDKARCDQELVDGLDRDLKDLSFDERTQLMDWLLANQLAKTAAGRRLMDSWEHSPSPLQRRTFWYQQARLRWTGQAPPPNSEYLLAALEGRLADEEPEVQWAMNFAAGQIGTFEPEHRARCVALGETTGLYRDEVVSRGCTPNYLPEFIRIQAEKHSK